MNTNFKPAPGCIVILPQYEDSEMSGVRIADSQSMMPVGKVVCAGTMPYRFPKLREGDMIAYQRGNYIETSVLLGGVPTKVTVINAPDFRGKFTVNERWNFNHIAAVFAIGAAAGWTLGQFFTFKGWIKRVAQNNWLVQFLVKNIGHSGRKRK